MTPSEKLRLEECIREASEILYNDSEPEKLETFEDIEKKVREQVLEEISPKIALFLSKRKHRIEKGKSGQSKVVWEK